MNKSNLIMLIGLALLVSMPASATITHRYDFVADANDVVGGLETVLESGAYIQGGELVLSGGTSPAARAVLDAEGIAINTYTEGVSIEMWFTATTLSGWTRVFDFGDTSGNDGGYYWFYTPSGPGNSRLALSTGGFPGWSVGEQVANGPALTADVQYHVVCVYDPTGGTGGNAAMRIYQDGVQVGQNNNVTMDLADVRNAYAYIGSAVYPGDPELQGFVDEFRIYDKPLNAAEVAFTDHFGADDARAIPLRSMAPVNGKQLVSTTPTLSWTPEPWVSGTASYMLYIGTDPNIADPNRPDVSGISTLMVSDLAATSYTIPIANRLAFFEDYYWRVDTVDDQTYQGVGMHFQTVPQIPAVTDQPAVAFVVEGDAAVFTAEAESVTEITTVQWFKDGSATPLSAADPDITIDTVYESTPDAEKATTILTIANTESADLGAYYVEFTNAAGIGISVTADLVFKELLAHWPLDTDLADISGNGYDGTQVGGTSLFAAGQVGQALNFDGTDDFVDLPDGIGDDFRGGFTFTFWAYPRTAANWARFLSFNNGSDNDNIFFTRNGTGTTLRLHVYRGNSGAGGVLDAQNTLELNTWQMLTATLDENGQAVLYKNGAQIAAGTIQMPRQIARTNNWIGESAWSGDAFFNGLLDDMRVYNYGLTPTEVALLYTDVKTGEYVCVEDPENPLTYDVNGDCQVTLDDVAELALWWLQCERVPASACDAVN